MDCLKKGQDVFSRSEVGEPSEHGLTTGRYHNCSMDGCTGVRVCVKWDDGTRTFPCTKGMILREVVSKKETIFSWHLM